MPWENRLDKYGILVNRAWGNLDDEEVVALVRNTHEMMVKAETLMCLSDFREVLSEVTFLKLDELPRLYRVLGVPTEMTCAMVLPTTKHRMEDYQFFENVCQLDGYNVKLFESHDKARQWLLEG